MELLFDLFYWVGGEGLLLLGCARWQVLGIFCLASIQGGFKLEVGALGLVPAHTGKGLLLPGVVGLLLLAFGCQRFGEVVYTSFGLVLPIFILDNAQFARLPTLHMKDQRHVVLAVLPFHNCIDFGGDWFFFNNRGIYYRHLHRGFLLAKVLDLAALLSDGIGIRLFAYRRRLLLLAQRLNLQPIDLFVCLPELHGKELGDARPILFWTYTSGNDGPQLRHHHLLQCHRSDLAIDPLINLRLIDALIIRRT